MATIAATAATALVKQFAPDIPELVGDILGDKAGRIADNVLDVAATITGLKDPKEIAIAMRENQKMQFEFQHRMSEIDVKREEIAHKDRASARDREVKLAQAGVVDHTPRNIAYVCLGMFVLNAIMLFFVQLPEGRTGDTIIMMIQASINLVSVAVAYYLGSSKGSKDKDASVTKAAEELRQAQKEAKQAQERLEELKVENEILVNGGTTGGLDGLQPNKNF